MAAHTQGSHPYARLTKGTDSWVGRAREDAWKMAASGVVMEEGGEGEGGPVKREGEVCME